MKTTTLTLVTAAAAVAAWAATVGLAHAAPAELQGTWREAAQGHTIDIAPCAEAADTLCVRVLADRPGRGQPSRAGAVVARQLTNTSAQQWRGEFLGPEGQSYPIHITLTSADRFDYKVCVLPGLCDGGAYARLAP